VQPSRDAASSSSARLRVAGGMRLRAPRRGLAAEDIVSRALREHEVRVEPWKQARSAAKVAGTGLMTLVCELEARLVADATGRSCGPGAKVVAGDQAAT
jgi:hypothetical protein